MQAAKKADHSESLSKSVSKGTSWMFLFQASDNLLGLIRLIILARFLSPNDFGLVGIAWLILQIINTFTQTGIQQALIHKTNIENYLNTAWTYLLFRGFILYLILFVSAPFLANFFNAETAIPVIQAIGLSLIFEGLMNIGIIYFQKNFAFHKHFILQITGNLVDFIVAIIAAIILQNVWAIIYGTIASGIVRFILSYILSNYRPRFEFNLNAFKEMTNYGKWIAGSNILQFIYSQGDDLLVGKLLGTTSLGYYQLAYRISNLPATQITHLISTVMFPAYAKIQNDIVRVSKIYLSVLQVIAYLSFFVGTIIICFANDFTILFLGEKWLPIVLSMQILTVWGVLRSIGATTGPVWQALGKPDIVTKIQILQVLILILIIYPLTVMHGIAGAATAVVISALIPNIIAIFSIKNTLQCSLWPILSTLFWPFIASILVVFILTKVRDYALTEINVFSFILLAVISIFSYLIITLLFNKLFGYHIYKNLFSFFESLPMATNYKRYMNKVKSIFI